MYLHFSELKDMDLSCQINTDGVRLFKSGDNTIWPIFISLNEMSFKKRRRNTLLVGLWFGGSKPNFSTFLKPFVQRCNELYNDPLVWSHRGRTYRSRVVFPIVTVDSGARPAIQGFKQHNGFYGCPWCLCPGERHDVRHNFNISYICAAGTLILNSEIKTFFRKYISKCTPPILWGIQRGHKSSLKKTTTFFDRCICDL